ncbi:hypothetical protein [Phytomonospora endophytica]|uniref:Uncharacterized protein n=1 Tax=Phytomonospora endophytica TaxID=714109 RepID=A0A841FHU8_9ACTN|nr:hypothetical protein [Phytomonospora endophytica]MBB6033152.1 hypothetical protein [Phytomonospora endophytica]GIG65377.1 hypothetical protein Pen01_16720 [Phytomonospora endophytica]
MTRELERVLRATFEDRSRPVPPQTDGLADTVIGRARGVRRRRVMAGGASALAVVVLAGLALVFGRGVSPSEDIPTGDNLPIPVIAGLDVAVPNPSDKSGPYLQAGDGTRVSLPPGEELTDAVRVDGGFFAITTREENSHLAFYPLSGPSQPIADGRKLAMAVDANYELVAVTRVDGRGVRLDVYGFDGSIVGEGRQLGPDAVLGGWSNSLVMYEDGDQFLQAWNPTEGIHFASRPEKAMRFMGPTTDWSTYVTYQDPAEGGPCLGSVEPFDDFRVLKRFCYRELPSEAITVSPNGEWFVARGYLAPDQYRFSSTHLSQDLGSDTGSMQPLPGFEVKAWMWLSDQELVYESEGTWYRFNLYTMAADTLPIPADSSATPVTIAFKA